MYLCARRRQAAACLFFGLPLVAATVQVCVLLANRVAVGQGGPKPLGKLINLWAHYVSFATWYQLFGWATFDPVYVRVLYAVCFALCVGWSLVRRPPGFVTQMMWPAIIGLTTLLVGVMMAVATYTDKYEPHGGHYDIQAMLFRHHFVPLVALYLTLVLAFCNLVPRRMSTWVLLAWLPLAWPFGFCWPVPPPDWTLTSYSAWHALAPAVFAKTGKAQSRGCIPINPYPWYFALDCTMLLTLEDPGAVVGRAPLPAARSYPAPQAAADWLVDTIGMRIVGDKPGTRTLVARDKDGHDLGRGVEVVVPHSPLTYFVFEQPVRSPHRLDLEHAASNEVFLVLDSSRQAPLWVWFGRSTT